MGAAGSISQSQSDEQKEKTLFDAYGELLKKNNIVIGASPFWQKWQILNRAQEIAIGLIAKGINVDADNANSSPCIGIYFQTALEYKISVAVCRLFNMIAVPLFDAIGPAACAYIINRARIQTIVCDRIENVEVVLSSMSSPSIERQASDFKINIMTFSELEELGQRSTRVYVTWEMFTQMCIPHDVLYRQRSNNSRDFCLTRRDFIDCMQDAKKCISRDSHAYCKSSVLDILRKEEESAADQSNRCAVMYLAKRVKETEKHKYYAQLVKPMNSGLQFQETGTRWTVVMNNSYSQLQDFAKNVDNIQLTLEMKIMWDGYLLKLVISYQRINRTTFEEIFTEYGRSENEAIEKVASKTIERSSVLQANKLVAFINEEAREAIGYYPRTDYQKGYALIVCFTEGRKGADMEIKNMERIMQNVLKFCCKIVKDPDFDEINEIIEEAATFLGKYSESFYCFTFFIMGHGNTNGVVIDQEERLLTFDHIVTRFKNDKLQRFTGKPKAFFFNCCRGERYGESWNETDSIPQISIEKDVRKFRIPTDGDIFIAYSTIDGHVSLRCEVNGSYFIESCATIFEQNYSTMHLEEMMIDVKADIARKLEGEEKTIKGKIVAQMPCTWSTLTRRLYLQPC